MYAICYISCYASDYTMMLNCSSVLYNILFVSLMVYTADTGCICVPLMHFVVMLSWEFYCLCCCHTQLPRGHLSWNHKYLTVLLWSRTPIQISSSLGQCLLNYNRWSKCHSQPPPDHFHHPPAARQHMSVAINLIKLYGCGNHHLTKASFHLIV